MRAVAVIFYRKIMVSGRIDRVAAAAILKSVMKILIYILMILAVVVIGYNVTLLNFNDLMEDRSALALIGIVSAACVLVLLVILLMSKAIEKKQRG